MGKINNRLINADPQLSSTSENPVQNKAVKAAVDAKQDTLVSGTNIKTINSESLLGSGNIEIDGSADLYVVDTLPLAGEEDGIYLARFNAAAADGIVELPVPTQADAGKSFVVGSDGSVELSSVSITVDSQMSSTSENPVQNKVITAALGGKVDAVSGKGLSTNDFTNTYKDNVDANTTARHTHSNKSVLDATTASYTTAEQTKLSGIEAGAEVNTVTSVAGKTGAVMLAKADVGLGNVDNTSDLNKPVSTATQTALDAKQATLVSGTNIKTINSTTLLGSGNIEITGHDIDIVASLPTTLEDDTIYLADTNASSAGGVVEFPVPTASDAGKAFVIGESGSVWLVQPNADWEASSGVAQILNKPAYATDADIDALFE